MLLFANNADSTLKVSATATDTALYLADGTGGRFPAAGAGNTFFVTLVDSLGNVEIVEVTARTGDVLTVDRARDGTTAKPFPQGSVVDHRVVAEVLRRLSPESLRGADNGLAPLDGDGRLPDQYLPLTLLTEAVGDGRYVQLTQANAALGFVQLDAASKVPATLLPANLLTADSAGNTYLRKDQLGAANGAASLGADGKVPTAQLSITEPDLSGLAPKLNPTFSAGLTAGGTATFSRLAATDLAQLAAVEAQSLQTTEPVVVMGGQPRGRLTFSTLPPSGTPGNGDEWVQHEA